MFAHFPQCKLCCKATDDSICKVYFNSTKQSTLLTDGKVCGDGICVQGTCKVNLQCPIYNTLRSHVQCTMYLYFVFVIPVPRFLQLY